VTTSDLVDGECLHGMNPDWCGLCNGRDGGETAERQRRDNLMALSGVCAAQWSGRCGQCNERFDADDPIKSDGMGGWLGPCCFD
jgi:hypothetical protein